MIVLRFLIRHIVDYPCAIIWRIFVQILSADFVSKDKYLFFWVEYELFFKNRKTMHVVLGDKSPYFFLWNIYNLALYLCFTIACVCDCCNWLQSNKIVGKHIKSTPSYKNRKQRIILSQNNPFPWKESLQYGRQITPAAFGTDAASPPLCGSITEQR